MIDDVWYGVADGLLECLEQNLWEICSCGVSEEDIWSRKRRRGE
jgi:hypothetical protein